MDNNQTNNYSSEDPQQQQQLYQNYVDYEAQQYDANNQNEENKINNQLQDANKNNRKASDSAEVLKINNTQLKLIRTSKIDLKLFVGQLPKNWNEKDVTQFFSKYGEILESQIIRDPKSGQHKGCAFVKFASMTEAENAIDSLHNRILPGMSTPMQIKWADGEADRLGVNPGSTPKLFIGSLPKECSEQNLRDIFEPFGAFEELHLMRDQEGRSKGCAFIRFERNESALLAIRNLNAQAYLENSDRPIEVRFAERRQQKEEEQVVNQEPQAEYTVPKTNLVFSQYFTQDGVAYYFNWATNTTQYEKPPAGAIIFTPDGQQYVMPAEVKNTPQNLNDLSSSVIDIKDPGMKKTGPAGANLFIFHLPNDFRDSDLKKLFDDFGQVISVRVMTKPDGKSKGYGFVSYSDPNSAQKAIVKLNGYQVGGRRLKVEIKKGDGNEEAAQKYTTSLGQTKFNPF